MDNEERYKELAEKLIGRGRSPKAWLKAFYPITAKGISNREGVTALELAEHSFTKWLGLQKWVLQQCNLYVMGGDIRHTRGPESIMTVGGISCSLCWAYHRGAGSCTICPIYRDRDFVPCTSPVIVGEESPWEQWTRRRNPIPMLESLEEAIKFVKNSPSLYQGGQYQSGDRL